MSADNPVEENQGHVRGEHERRTDMSPGMIPRESFDVEEDQARTNGPYSRLDQRQMPRVPYDAVGDASPNHEMSGIERQAMNSLRGQSPGQEQRSSYSPPPSLANPGPVQYLMSAQQELIEAQFKYLNTLDPIALMDAQSRFIIAQNDALRRLGAFG